MIVECISVKFLEHFCAGGWVPRNSLNQL